MRFRLYCRVYDFNGMFTTIFGRNKSRVALLMAHWKVRLAKSTYVPRQIENQGLEGKFVLPAENLS